MKPAILVEDLTKIYRIRKKSLVTALKDIRLSVQPGEVVGVLGPNGAGKTTLIKCILGLVEPESGRIEIMGFDLKRQNRDALSSMGAVLEGSRNIFWRLTVRENLEYFTRLHGLSAKTARPIIGRLIETFALEPHILKEARMLSKGFQQRLSTACALVKQTPVLMLDEPTLGLDIESSLNIRGSLRLLAREEGRTILLTSHEMEMIEAVAERVIILQGGQLLVDEAVSNLKQLFRSASYVCDFQSPDGQPTVVDKELRNLGVLRSLEPFDEKWRVELEFSDPADIYKALEYLRQANCLIEAINRQEPDLKEAYLRLTNSEVRKKEAGSYVG